MKSVLSILFVVLLVIGKSAAHVGISLSLVSLILMLFASLIVLLRPAHIALKE